MRALLPLAILIGCAHVHVVPRPVAPVEPPRVTFRFARPIARPTAEIPLPDGEVLVLGGGRRMLVGPGGAVRDADDYAEEELRDGVLTQEGLRVVGAASGVFAAATPLGPLHRIGRFREGARFFAAGRRALFALAEDGTLQRTEDGIGYATTSLPLRPGDRIIAMTADPRGAVLVVIAPQRALLSADDGLTFSEIPTPGQGALGARRDGRGRVFLENDSGMFARASLDPPALLVDAAAPPRIAERVPTPRVHDRWLTSAGWHLAGNRVVDIRYYGDAPYLYASKSYTKSTRIGLALLRDDGSYENELLTDVFDEVPRVFATSTTDPPRVAIASTKRLQIFDQAGPKWSAWFDRDIFFAGFEIHTAGAFTTISRQGETPELCVAHACRPLGLAQVRGLAHDPKRDVLYLLDEKGVYVANASEPTKLRPWKLDLARRVRFPSGPIDEGGTLRLFDAGERTIHQLALDGSANAVEVPFDKLDLVGARGLAVRAGQAWETADGGLHWTPVNAPKSEDVACAPMGCLLSAERLGAYRADYALRVGWQLPAGTTSGTSAADIPPLPQGPATVVTPKARPHSHWRCTSSKKLLAAAWSTMGLHAAPAPGVDWLWLHDDRFVVIAERARGPRDVELLPKSAAPQTSWVRTQIASNAQGFAIARYTHPFKAKGIGYAPVDVELAWLRFSSGKLHRARRTDTFRVSSNEETAVLGVTDDGLVFMPRRGDVPLVWLRDDGTSRELPRLELPKSAGDTDVVGRGAVLHLLASELPYDQTPQATLAQLEGGSWVSRRWAVVEPPLLRSSAGSPTLLWPPAGLSPWSLTVDPSPPPAGKEIDASTPRCSGASGTRREVWLPYEEEGFDFDAWVDGQQHLAGHGLVASVDAKGACLSAAVLDIGQPVGILALDAPNLSTMFVDRVGAFRMSCEQTGSTGP